MLYVGAIPNSLLIIHYHFKKGGVTDVISRALKAIAVSAQIDNTHYKITLASGEKENALSYPYKDRDISRVSINSIEIPTLQYYSQSKVFDDSHVSQLQDFFDEYTASHRIWWVHNHHLGKNPYFTKLLMQHLDNTQQPCILHMHDFPESARFANLALLQNVLPLSACYSAMPHTQYAVINSIDKMHLKNGGLQAHYIPNIIPAVTPVTTSHAHEVLYELAPHHAAPPQEATLFTYPVRCIRRKNVLEGALIAKAYAHYINHACNFNITLAGLSEQEKQYSETVKSLFEDGTICGFFNLGAHADNTLALSDMCGASDVVISSSVQEGFGFSYIGAAMWGCPLLARDIPVTQDSKKALHAWRTHWYSSVDIPWAILSNTEKQELDAAYMQKICALQDMGVYTHTNISQLQAELKALMQAPTIDFSFLSVNIQVNLLKNFTACGDDIIRANSAFLEKTHGLVKSKNAITKQEVSSVQKNVETHFGERAFLSAFEFACATTKQDDASSKTPAYNPKVVAQIMLQKNARLSLLRLMLNPYPA